MFATRVSLRHTTTFTYSHANTPLGQSERACFLSYFINIHNSVQVSSSIGYPQVRLGGTDLVIARMLLQ